MGQARLGFIGDTALPEDELRIGKVRLRKREGFRIGRINHFTRACCQLVAIICGDTFHRLNYLNLHFIAGFPSYLVARSKFVCA